MPLSESPLIPQYASLDLQGVNTVRSAAPPEEAGDLFRLADFLAGKIALQTYTDNLVAVSKNELLTKIQALQQGLQLKDIIRVASLQNISLTSNLPTVDGIKTQKGDRVALLNQTNAIENGLYLVNESGLSRTKDADSSEKLPPGTAFRVKEGSFKLHFFVLKNTESPKIGIDSIFFVDETPILVLAGLGLVYDPTTNAYNVQGTDNRILVKPDSIDISPAYDLKIEERVLGVERVANSRLEAIESAGYQVFSQIKQAIDNAILQYSDSTEKTFVLENGIVSGITKTYRITHNFNSKDIVLLGLQIIGTGASIQPGDFKVISLTQIEITFTSSSLPVDGTIKAFLKKMRG